jgi:hypothetical protein
MGKDRRKDLIQSHNESRSAAGVPPLSPRERLVLRFCHDERWMDGYLLIVALRYLRRRKYTCIDQPQFENDIYPIQQKLMARKLKWFSLSRSFERNLLYNFGCGLYSGGWWINGEHYSLSDEQRDGIKLLFAMCEKMERHKRRPLA